MIASRTMQAWIAGTACWIAGCQPDSASPDSPPVASGAGPAVVTASPPPAESSLTIQRGIAKLATESRTLRLCGETADLWLAGQGETLDEIYAKLAGEPGAPLYVEVRGERTPSPGGTVVPAGFAQTFLLEEVLFAAMPGEGGGCEGATPDYRVRAAGNEPFWSVDIIGDRMVFRQPDAAEPFDLAVSESGNTEGTVTYRGSGNGQVLEMTVSAQPCSDSMSGAYFAYAAEGRLDGRELRGCARLGNL